MDEIKKGDQSVPFLITHAVYDGVKDACRHTQIHKSENDTIDFHDNLLIGLQIYLVQCLSIIDKRFYMMGMHKNFVDTNVDMSYK